MNSLSAHGLRIKRVPPLDATRLSAAGGKGPLMAWRLRAEDFVSRPVSWRATHTPVHVLLLPRPKSTKERFLRGFSPSAAQRPAGKALITLLVRSTGRDAFTTIIAAARGRGSPGPLLTLDVRDRRGNVRRNKLVWTFVTRQSRRQDRDEFDEWRRDSSTSGLLRSDRPTGAVFTTARASASASRLPDVAVFKGPRFHRRARHSRSDFDDTVISLAFLRHVDATAEERADLPCAGHSAMRRARGEELRRGELPTGGDNPF